MIVECVQTIVLTTAPCVHSNVYGLGRIMRLTAVDPIHFTSSMVQTYDQFSGSAKITGSFSSIGKEPVPYSPSVILATTRSFISYAEKGIVIVITNVLQGDKTIVLVCHISE